MLKGELNNKLIIKTLNYDKQTMNHEDFLRLIECVLLLEEGEEVYVLTLRKGFSAKEVKRAIKTLDFIRGFDYD